MKAIYNVLLLLMLFIKCYGYNGNSNGFNYYNNMEGNRGSQDQPQLSPGPPQDQSSHHPGPPYHHHHDHHHHHQGPPPHHHPPGQMPHHHPPGPPPHHHPPGPPPHHHPQGPPNHHHPPGPPPHHHSQGPPHHRHPPGPPPHHHPPGPPPHHHSSEYDETPNGINGHQSHNYQGKPHTHEYTNNKNVNTTNYDYNDQNMNTNSIKPTAFTTESTPVTTAAVATTEYVMNITTKTPDEGPSGLAGDHQEYIYTGDKIYIGGAPTKHTEQKHTDKDENYEIDVRFKD